MREPDEPGAMEAQIAPLGLRLAPQQDAPSSGKYTIKVDPAGATTGTATITLTSP
jgi:hypothetical protein